MHWVKYPYEYHLWQVRWLCSLWQVRWLSLGGDLAVQTPKAARTVKIIRKSDEELHNHHKSAPNWIEVSKNSTVTLTCYSVNPVEWYGVYFNNQNKDIGESTLTLFNLEVVNTFAGVFTKKSIPLYFMQKLNYCGWYHH